MTPAARTRLLNERERLEVGLSFRRILAKHPPAYWDRRARELHAADLAWREGRLGEIGRMLDAEEHDGRR